MNLVDAYNDGYRDGMEAAKAKADAQGVFVPKKAWDWLMGLGENFEPRTDAPKVNGQVGLYWWRWELRRRIDEARVASTSVKEKR